MRFKLSMLVCVLAASLASTVTAFDEPVVYVASTPVAMGVDETYAGRSYGTLGIGVNINSYDCVTLHTGGCPAGTQIINDEGNLGCNTGCTGTCTRCSGNTSAGVVSLCKKKNNAICTLTLTKVQCGTKGSGTCLTATGGGDNQGCDCTTPASYGTDACSFNSCV